MSGGLTGDREIGGGDAFVCGQPSEERAQDHGPWSTACVVRQSGGGILERFFGSVSGFLTPSSQRRTWHAPARPKGFAESQLDGVWQRRDIWISARTAEGIEGSRDGGATWLQIQRTSDLSRVRPVTGRRAKRREQAGEEIELGNGRCALHSRLG
ncbi:hypothetical protein LY76DRAFT_595697 [Colletotrichum caudatum]|nr:hypothetical protein LY76DRAFT_595697 [Colletotrichum caudatum]